MLLDNEALYDNSFHTLKFTTPTCFDFNHDSTAWRMPSRGSMF